MTRELDHLVLPVDALAVARRRYAALGFTVSPDARHPFGTANCRIFFRSRTYLEPIAVADADAVTRGVGEGLVFLKRIEDYRARHREGFAMAALKSPDAESDRQRYAGCGAALGETFSFVGTTRDEQGIDQEYGVRLAFAATAEAPDAALFACEPTGNAPAVSDGTRFTTHPNTAIGIVHVIAVAQDPGRFERFLSVVSGGEPVRSSLRGVDWDLGNAGMTVMTPAAFLSGSGFSAPDPGDGFRLCAFDVGVANIDLARECAGASAIDVDERLIVPPAPGQGAFVGFVRVAPEDGRR